MTLECNESANRRRCLERSASLSFAARCGRFAVHSNPADQQSRKHIVSLVVAKDKNPPAGGRDSNMVNGRHTQLAAIRQVDGEWHERRCVNKFSNIGVIRNKRRYPDNGLKARDRDSAS